MENNPITPAPTEPHGNTMDIQAPNPPQGQPIAGPGPSPATPPSVPAGFVTPPVTDHPPSQPTPTISQQKTRSMPLVAVVVAIVIALGLIGLAVFAYFRHKDMPAGEHHHMSSTEVTTNDVDNTGKDVDNALSSANDNKDLPESDLSDQALGL